MNVRGAPNESEAITYQASMSFFNSNMMIAYLILFRISMLSDVYAPVLIPVEHNVVKAYTQSAGDDVLDLRE
jgi:hypothetical protein